MGLPGDAAGCRRSRIAGRHDPRRARRPRPARAALRSSEDPGGSTIAQQLAKRLYPRGGGVIGTLEEIGLGVKLSLHYSHEQVLDMYLNSIYYGNGYWGVVAASHGYIAVSPRRLTWGEASLLAGLPQAPSAYDPVYHLPLARLRQRHVLDQLVANGDLTSPRPTPPSANHCR
jgi:membrane peptidoglycan carboxypeptidase